MLLHPTIGPHLGCQMYQQGLPFGLGQEQILSFHQHELDHSLRLLAQS